VTSRALSWLHDQITAPERPRLWSSLDDWWKGYSALTETLPNPLDRAVAGGFCADRLAFAFSSGHQSALRRLLPHLPTDRVAALCITEAGGGHPRQIATTLQDGALTGEKKYTTLLPLAEILLVAARRGERPDGRPDLCVVEVDAGSPGVTKLPMPDTPFCPEIPHGVTQLEGVKVAADAVLPGDGYIDVIKAFRTAEDLHVVAAVAGYLARVALDHRWPDPFLERALGLVAACAGLDALPHNDRATHLALAGCFQLLKDFTAAVEPMWRYTDEEVAKRWRRDQPVLGIAGKVREVRRQRAWGR